MSRRLNRPGLQGAYLPALEEPEIIEEIIPIFRPRPVDAEIDQLKAKVIRLEATINKYFDKKKNKVEAPF